MKPQPPRSGQLFNESEDKRTPAGLYLAEVDGASRGNPGPASYAVVFRGPDGEVEWEQGKFIGRSTNNVAEYYGLLAALDHASSVGIRNLRVRSDSELMVRQMQGRYKVKSLDLKPLHERAMKEARALDYFVMEHVLRERNRLADRLANEALDRAAGNTGRAAISGSDFTSNSSQSRATPETNSSSRNAKRIRAQYRNGALHPAKEIELQEGDEVEITIHRPKSPS